MQVIMLKTDASIRWDQSMGQLKKVNRSYEDISNGIMEGDTYCRND